MIGYGMAADCLTDRDRRGPRPLMADSIEKGLAAIDRDFLSPRWCVSRHYCWGTRTDHINVNKISQRRSASLWGRVLGCNQKRASFREDFAVAPLSTSSTKSAQNRRSDGCNRAPLFCRSGHPISRQRNPPTSIPLRDFFNSLLEQKRVSCDAFLRADF